MPSAFGSGLAADPRLGLGLLGVLLVFALALLAQWRREALGNAHDPARQAWFVFAIRVHLLLLAAWLVGPAITAMARPERGLLALVPAWAPLAPMLGLGLLGVLPIGLTLAAVIVAGDVERRVRGTGVTQRERLSNAALGLGVALLPLIGLVVANAMLRSGNYRAAAGCAIGGIVVALWLGGRRAAVLGLRPEAETSGPLRDRLFELAARARVRVRQVYVLAASRIKMANAFAVRGGNVLLTDHLLGHLSRREVGAVIAHELAHLQHHHPAKLSAAFVVPFALGFGLASYALGSRFTWLGTAPGFALAGVLAGLSFVWWARRFEFQADRGAVRLTGDAPALITALVRIARLNSTPVDWSRALEWLLTHPSVRRRALALAASGHLSAAEANQLVDVPPDDPERWNLPTAARQPVFGTTARLARINASGWILLVASVAAPALVFVLLRAAGAVVGWPVAFALGVIVSLAATFAAVDLLATAGYEAWQRAIAERRGRTIDDPSFVGLAPGEGDMTYEGFADWDLGYLDLDPVALRFEGERARFTLERDRIVSIEQVKGMPSWIPAPRVAVRWRAADGSAHSFSVRDGRARMLHEIAGRSLLLLDTLRQWHAEPAPFGVRPLTGGEPPRPDAVTGIPYAELASPRTLLQVVPMVGALAVVVVLAAGLPFVPGRGPGAFQVIAAGVITVVALRIPVWRASRARGVRAAGARSTGPKQTVAEHEAS